MSFFLFLVKLAVTEVAAVSVTWHVPVPEQPPPDQPPNFEPEPAEAVSVTDVPFANDAEQVEPQSIPAGELVTEPDPLPDVLTVSVTFGTNVAVTVAAALSVT